MKKALSIVTLLATAGCAMGPSDFSESGFHVAGSVIRSWDEFDEDDDVDLEGDETTGWGARAGYRFLNHFAVEVLYEDLGDFNVGPGDIGITAVMAQGKAYLFTGRFQPYGLVGIGYVDADVSSDDDGFDPDESDLAYRAGLGLEVYIIPLVFVFGEGTYTWPTDDLDKLDYVSASIGVGLHF